VFGEVELTVQSHGGLFEWKGYGFRLHVSEGSLPAGMSKCRINIRASLTGKFQLPEDSGLISPVFWITAPCKFTKPVLLEIQHCAFRESEAALSNLSFVFSICSQRDLPYKFRQMGGGVFSIHSSYGSIQLSHFSGLAITEREGTSRLYCAHLYHTMKHMHDWRYYFVITQDLDVKNMVHAACILSDDFTYYRVYFHCRLLESTMTIVPGKKPPSGSDLSTVKSLWTFLWMDL